MGSIFAFETIFQIADVVSSKFVVIALGWLSWVRDNPQDY